MSPTIINNPGSSNDSGSGFVASVVVVILLIILFFWFGLPRLRNNGSSVNVNVPTTSVGY